MTNNKKNGGSLAFLFLILSIISIFIFADFVGLTLAIISLIFSIKDLKCKNALVYISLFGSIVTILFHMFSFFIAFNILNDSISKAKISTYENYRDRLESFAELYILNENIEHDDSDFILTDETIIENTSMKKMDECDGYVIINKNENKCEAYVKCGGYKTDGFDSKYLRGNYSE